MVPEQLKHKEIIKCTPKGKYVGNYKCHVNCLSYALRHPDKVKSIVGVLQVFNDSEGVAHFVLEMADGTYHDPTYGNMSGIMDSYCIPIEYYKVESFKPARELQNLKDYLFSLRHWFYRLTHKNQY